MVQGESYLSAVPAKYLSLGLKRPLVSSFILSTSKFFQYRRGLEVRHLGLTQVTAETKDRCQKFLISGFDYWSISDLHGEHILEHQDLQIPACYG